jgi:hypothetical protein
MASLPGLLGFNRPARRAERQPIEIIGKLGSAPHAELPGIGIPDHPRPFLRFATADLTAVTRSTLPLLNNSELKELLLALKCPPHRAEHQQPN